MVDSTPYDMVNLVFDIDTVENMIYYYDWRDDKIKRAPLDPLDQGTPITLYTQDGLALDGIAVDWIGRYNMFSLFEIFHVTPFINSYF